MFYDAGKEALRQQKIDWNRETDAARARQGLPPLYESDGITLSGNNNSLAGFVNANANAGKGGLSFTPSQSKYTAQLGTDFGNARDLLAKYLNTSAQDMPNRFESMLSQSQNRVNSLLDNPDSIQQSAAYKFRLGQGMEGVNRSMAAKGLLGSGNRLAALNDYAQGQASQEYDNQYNRLASLLGQNMQGYLGDKNANTSMWGAKANALGSYYQGAANNALQDQQTSNADRLGWASLANQANAQSNADRLGWASVYQRGNGWGM